MKRRTTPLIPVCLLLALALAGRSLAADITREFTFTKPDLLVSNLVGAVDVRAGTGDAFKVTVTVRGADATPEIIRMEPGADGAELAIRFPLEKHSTFVYPTLGHGSHTTLQLHENDEQEKSWLRRTFGLLTGKRITVRGGGSGLEVWADVTIEVPAGGELTVRHGVGLITAGDLQADLDLESYSGAITVDKLRGDLRADTGSGDVKAGAIDGDLSVDTGSGEVELRDCRGKTAKVDTGSGGVEASGVQCTTLSIDTGSGAVNATAIGADEAVIDTGSGNVELSLDRMGDGKFVVDTGSGDVALVLPADASAKILADTGSGDVDSTYPGASFEKLDDGTRKLVLGDGAATVTLDTGSGAVLVSRK